MMLWSLIRGCSEPRSLERRRCKCSPDDLRDRFQRICSSDACAQPLSLFPITRIMRYSFNRASYLRRRRWAGFRVNARTAPSNACGYIRLVFACSWRNYRDSEAKRLLNAVTGMCLRTLWSATCMSPARRVQVLAISVPGPRVSGSHASALPMRGLAGQKRQLFPIEQWNPQSKIFCRAE